MKRYLQITSGRGPVECCRVVWLVAREILKEAAARNIAAEIFDTEDGLADDTWFSATLTLEGDGVESFIREWSGTVQWTAQSTYRPHHRRKNWFVGVAKIVLPQEMPDFEKDFRYETSRSSGPGGQNVNKVESAVKAIHTPTGMSATASERRSQLENRKLATQRLLHRLAVRTRNESDALTRQNWNNHNSLQRGNPVKIFRRPM